MSAVGARGVQVVPEVTEGTISLAALAMFSSVGASPISALSTAEARTGVSEIPRTPTETEVKRPSSSRFTTAVAPASARSPTRRDTSTKPWPAGHGVTG